MNLPTIVVAASLILGAQHPQMPPGMSHEEHLKQMQKDDALKNRGAAAMGFDQDTTTHHFRLTSTGGAIEVAVRNGEDTNTLAAVRAHLRTIADEFARGRFDKPFQTHGEVPPGVEVMQDHAGAIAFRYEDLPAGAAVRIDSRIAELVDAVHAFLRYQITEHRTGDSLEVTR